MLFLCKKHFFQLEKTFAGELEYVLAGQRVDEDELASLIARLRLVRSFNTVRGRHLSIIARLLSLSILGMFRCSV